MPGTNLRRGLRGSPELAQREHLGDARAGRKPSPARLAPPRPGSPGWAGGAGLRGPWPGSVLVPALRPARSSPGSRRLPGLCLRPPDCLRGAGMSSPRHKAARACWQERWDGCPDRSIGPWGHGSARAGFPRGSAGPSCFPQPCVPGHRAGARLTCRASSRCSTSFHPCHEGLPSAIAHPTSPPASQGLLLPSNRLSPPPPPTSPQQLPSVPLAPLSGQNAGRAAARRLGPPLGPRTHA